MSDIYDDKSIESLDPREHVRLRSGMYIGANDNPNQLLLEVFSNALDEHNIGHGDRINVYIGDDGVCSVEDYGQGFPINVIRDDDKTVLEAAYSVINTSGKYRDDGVYSGSSLGSNGVGAKLANFLSEYCEVVTGRDNKYEHIWFKDGLFQKRELGEWNQHSGTCVTYKPDAQFFDTNKTDIAYFEKFFNDIACLCPSLTIVLNNKPIKHNGLDDLISIYNGDIIELISNRFNYHSTNCDICFTFTGKSNTDIRAYVNYGLTDSGPHISGIKSALTRVLNNWARENGILKDKDKNLDGNSVQEGMFLACNIVSTGVTYNSQTKEKIVKMDTSFLTEFSAQLEIWLDNNPDDAKIIIDKALIARKAAEAAKKAREAVKNKNNKKDKIFKLPTTLTDCWTKDRAKTELLICEGKSAASGLVAARDSEFQAVYGVRGKMLSVLKTKQENIVKNQEINNLIQALGLEYNPNNAKCIYDKSKLRYGKIIAAADADFDGFAIENLLFNILWYICPELIINGHVYSAVPPLYRVTTKKNKYVYLRDDSALEDWKKKNSNNVQSIGRMKGLGEQDSEELAYCLLEPKTRNLYQLTVSDIDKTNNMFNDLYGKNVEPRVKFLEKHLEEARVD